MEPRADLTPGLTIVVPALGGLDTVRRVLDVWQRQSRRDELELVVLCPDVEDVPGLRLVDSRGLLLHEARARGVRAAGAPYVFLAEDHCVPDDGWSEAILPRLAESWDGIGCALRAGDTSTASLQAAFLLGYGEWMPPLAFRAVRVLAGHNVVLRREPLQALGHELEDLLIVGAFLTRQLGRSGRFVVEPTATMRHFDAVSPWSLVRIFSVVGASFGAVRTRAWPFVARCGYPLAVPLVAAAHWRRAFTQYGRAGRANGMRPSSLAVAAFFAGVWAVGEAVGAILGPERVAPHAWISETKPIGAAELDRVRHRAD